MTITSVEEFAKLSLRSGPGDFHRVRVEDAPAALWEEILRTRPDLRRWVAFNRTVSLDILDRLARDEDPDVRWAVAGRRNLTWRLFELLAGDADPIVRERVATNAKAPYDLVARLAGDDLPSVAEVAQRRLDDFPTKRLRRRPTR